MTWMTDDLHRRQWCKVLHLMSLLTDSTPVGLAQSKGQSLLFHCPASMRMLKIKYAGASSHKGILPRIQSAPAEQM